jgi:hypothetical protein
VHDTRHTFITLSRRDGARKDHLEKVTHNAVGDIVDRYTAVDWEPLCAAVACLRIDLHEHEVITPPLAMGDRKTGHEETHSHDFFMTPRRIPESLLVEAPGIEPGSESS